MLKILKQALSNIFNDVFIYIMIDMRVFLFLLLVIRDV